MKENEKLICICLGVFGIGGVIFGLVSIMPQTPEPSYTTSPTTISTSVSVSSSEPNKGYGIGETPGIVQPTPSQASELRNTANATGVSEQEMEQLRVQTIQYIQSGQAAADAAKVYPNPAFKNP